MSNTSIRPRLRDWLPRLLSGQPHQVIGDQPDPYLLRWYVIPRNPLFNVYLHKFLRDDDDRALHDHPWWFVSVILHGGYIEHTESPERAMVLRCRSALFDRRSPWRHRSVAYRPAEWRHRVALPHGRNAAGAVDESVPRVPCWTLIITGRRSRTWGFWCPDFAGRLGRRRVGEHFIPWDEFGDAGCGEPQ